MEEVEDIVLQLNDPSTQQIAQDTAPKDISELEEKIVAVEKQLHAALGATQKASLTEGTEICRLPTVHQLSNYIEHTRKRVKNIEDIKGTSKCVKLLQELEDNTTPTEGHVGNPNDDPAKPTRTTTRSTTRNPIIEDAPETEEDILERMIILSTPAEAKKAAI